MTAALFRPSLDYTDLDFDALLARLQQLIAAAFPKWTDQNVANFGNILVQLIAFTGDVQGFYQNKQARETRWSQAFQRKNLLSMIKLIGYVAAGAEAAQADVTFTIAAAALGTVTFPKGTLVSTLDVTAPIKYQLTDDLILSPGQTTAVATMENSEFESDTFPSTGNANQSVTLTRTPYLPGSLTVIASNGTFVEVESLLNSSATDRNFVVVVDQNDRARADFGNGINGAIPSGTLIANYKTGGGAAGVVEDGALTKIDGSFTDSFGNPVQVTVTNVLKSQGGADHQSNGSLRQLAPLSLRTSDRTIAREDYEIVALGLTTQVSRALMLMKKNDPGILENSGILFIVPPAGGTAPQSTFDAITAAFVARPYAPTFNLAIQQAPYLLINVFARIYLSRGAIAATVKSAVLTNLSAFFEDRISDPNSDDVGAPNPNVDFGFKIQGADGNPTGLLPLSNVWNVVRDTIGVVKMDPASSGFLLNGVHTDIPILTRQFPKLGTVTLINADTGVAL